MVWYELYMVLYMVHGAGEKERYGIIVWFSMGMMQGTVMAWKGMVWYGKVQYTWTEKYGRV